LATRQERAALALPQSGLADSFNALVCQRVDASLSPRAPPVTLL
jgi:hypothetical protein